MNNVTEQLADVPDAALAAGLAAAMGASDARIARYKTVAAIIAASMPHLPAPAESGFSAADMATAAAQGFRDGAASVNPTVKHSLTVAEPASSPSYDALLIIAQSVAAALSRAGIEDCDDPGEAIDVMRDAYETKIAALQPAGTLYVSKFRGNLENREFDYAGGLPEGTHKLYAAPTLRPITDEDVERAITVCYALVDELASGYPEDLTEAGWSIMMRAALESLLPHGMPDVGGE